MMDRGRMQHPHEVIRGSERQLERMARERPPSRSGGTGGSITVQIGPGYKSTGPTILAPEIPNPQVPIPTLTPRPFVGVTVWRRQSDGSWRDHDPLTGGLGTRTLPTSLTTALVPDGQNQHVRVGYSGIVWARGNKLVDIRRGVVHTPLRYDGGYAYSSYVLWADAQYAYMAAGSGQYAIYRHAGANTGVINYTATEPWTNNRGGHRRYSYGRTVGGYRIVACQDGALITVGTIADTQIQAVVGTSSNAMSINAEGNMVVVGGNRTWVLSGVDGRELGQAPYVVESTHGYYYVDAVTKTVLVTSSLGQPMYAPRYAITRDPLADPIDDTVAMGHQQVGIRSDTSIIPLTRGGTYGHPIPIDGGVIVDIDT